MIDTAPPVGRPIQSKRVSFSARLWKLGLVGGPGARGKGIQPQPWGPADLWKIFGWWKYALHT